MKSGEQRVIYWVMYEERARVKVSMWPDPERYDWGLRTTQHCGVYELATAQKYMRDLQSHVDNKTHFLERERSGPESHHLTEVWIEIEHRCRYEPNQAKQVLIPTITVAGESLGASEE